MTEKIDIVVTWVDSEDLNWYNEKNKYLGNTGINKIMNSDERYRNWNLIKYWFRGVERYAPWVNKIFFVTEGHLPEWLNTNHEKLVLVKHSDFIDQEFLPTYNSNVIELSLHKITGGLSENFVLFNDDMFLMNPTTQKDFFEDGLPKDIGVFSPIVPNYGGIASIVLNNLEVINKYFNKKSVLDVAGKKFFKLFYGKHLIKNFVALLWKPVLGFYDYHIPISHKKSVFKLLENQEKQLFLDTYKNKFRSKDEINHWLMRYWNLCSGDFIPRNINFGRYYEISNSNIELRNILMKDKCKVICVNDSTDIENFEETKKEILEIFEEKFPNKSKYEL